MSPDILFARREEKRASPLSFANDICQGFNVLLWSTRDDVYEVFVMYGSVVVIKPPVSSVLPPVTDHESHGYTSAHHHKNNKFHRGKHKRRKHKGQGKHAPGTRLLHLLLNFAVD